MTVPEASVDENHDAPPGWDDVWAFGKVGRLCCGPIGAVEYSHGWSAAAEGGGAEPVEGVVFAHSRPAGAEESHLFAFAQSNTYRSSNSISCARRNRNSSDLKSSFL